MKEGGIQLYDYFLKPGYIFVSREPAIISSVLGSCVAVTLWDSREQYGGMAQYLYPSIEEAERATARYGNAALNHLAKMFFEGGAARKDLLAQIFGGASLSEETLYVSEDNIRIARQILNQLEIRIVSEDVGGGMGRKLIYNTLTNEAVVYRANKLRKGDWYPYIHDSQRE
jgi:chemotaxis protein CheD